MLLTVSDDLFSLKVMIEFSLYVTFNVLIMFSQLIQLHFLIVSSNVDVLQDISYTLLCET